MIHQKASGVRTRRNRNSTRWCCTASVQNFGKDPTDFRDVPFNLTMLSQFTSDCLWASCWPHENHEDLKRVATNKHFPRTLIERKECIQYAGIAGLENIPLVTSYAAQRSSKKIDQDERSRVLRLYFVRWNLESTSIQQLSNQIG